MAVSMFFSIGDRPNDKSPTRAMYDGYLFFVPSFAATDEFLAEVPPVKDEFCHVPTTPVSCCCCIRRPAAVITCYYRVGYSIIHNVLRRTDTIFYYYLKHTHARARGGVVLVKPNIASRAHTGGTTHTDGTEENDTACDGCENSVGRARFIGVFGAVTAAAERTRKKKWRARVTDARTYTNTMNCVMAGNSCAP